MGSSRIFKICDEASGTIFDGIRKLWRTECFKGSYSLQLSSMDTLNAVLLFELFELLLVSSNLSSLADECERQTSIVSVSCDWNASVNADLPALFFSSTSTSVIYLSKIYLSAAACLFCAAL